MHTQRCSSEGLLIGMCNPCYRQLIPIHVRIQLFDPSLKRFLTKNRIPLFEEPLNQLRDVSWIINHVQERRDEMLARLCSAGF